MSDTPEKKGILNVIHGAVKWLFHYTLLPVVALLKGLVALFTYLHDELAKI